MTDVGPATPAFLLVGGAHIDRIARAAVPFRVGASHPGRSVERVGGAVLNAALALRCFGAEVSLLSARGGDAAAESVVRELAERGIDDHGVVWLDRATASYTAILEEHGELVAGIADMAIYDALTPRVLSRRHLKALVAQAPVLLTDANLSTASLDRILNTATGTCGAIAVSPEKVARLAGLLDRIDILFLSAAEARALTGLDASPMITIAALRDMGVRRAVLTDGPRAVTVLDGTSLFQQSPPILDRVTDVTGAGDTLAAVTMLGLARGRPLREAVRLGLAASAIRISTGFAPDTPQAVECMAAQLPNPIDSIKDCVA